MIGLEVRTIGCAMTGGYYVWRSLIAAAACGLGSFGVALAGTAAHRDPNPALETAAEFLIFHAIASLALCGLVSSLERGQSIVLTAAGAIVAGVALFSGDIASRTLLGTDNLPFIAPVGGAVLIFAWLIAGIGFLVSLRPR